MYLRLLQYTSLISKSYFSFLSAYLLAVALTYFYYFVLERKSFYRLGAKGSLVEFAHSLKAMFVGAIVSVASTMLSRRGFINLSEFGVVWQCLVLIVLHDTYFYFLHRLLHWRPAYWIHRLHHRQKYTTPYSAFSLSNSEAVLQFSFLPFVSLFLRHDVSQIYLYIIFFWNAFIHVEFSYLKQDFLKKWLAPLIHITHHRRGNVNFSLYFTFWDKIFGTRAIQ